MSTLSQTIKEVIEERIKFLRNEIRFYKNYINEDDNLIKIVEDGKIISLIKPLEEAYLKRIDELEKENEWLNNLLERDYITLSEKAQVYDLLMEMPEWTQVWKSQAEWHHFFATFNVSGDYKYCFEWDTPQEALQKLKEVLRDNK